MNSEISNKYSREVYLRREFILYKFRSLNIKRIMNEYKPLNSWQQELKNAQDKYKQTFNRLQKYFYYNSSISDLKIIEHLNDKKHRLLNTKIDNKIKLNQIKNEIAYLKQIIYNIEREEEFATYKRESRLDI